MIDRKEYTSEYYQRNKETMKAQSKNWSLNNRDKVRGRLKRIKYKDEKTPMKRAIRNIKRKTRYRFPLNQDIKCELCGASAQCHHHNTNPIKINKFNLFCKDCHNGIHNQLKLMGGKK